jgi:hypothetical protein
MRSKAFDVEFPSEVEQILRVCTNLDKQYVQAFYSNGRKEKR